MFKVIIAIIVSGLGGYLGGMAQERHYGLQSYLKGLDEGYGKARKIIGAYQGGFDKGFEEHAAMIMKLMDDEEDESEDSE